jgi:hypothetical protein
MASFGNVKPDGRRAVSPRRDASSKHRCTSVEAEPEISTRKGPQYRHLARHTMISRERPRSRTHQIRAGAGRSTAATYYAENYQQYLAKNPFGYRCHSNTGVKFPA